MKALCLPCRNVDSDQTDPNARDDSRNDELKFLDRRSLQDGTKDHNPASNGNTSFSAENISGQESGNGSEEAS